MYARSDIDPMIQYLKNDFWDDRNLNYTPLHDIGISRTLKYYTDPNSVLSSSLFSLVESSFDAWGDIADIKFERTLVEQEASIKFSEEFFSTSAGGTSFQKDANSTFVDSATIEFSTAQLTTNLETIYDSLVHEIGHALGLGHPGNYNGSASYNDVSFTYDSHSVSALSYINPEDNPTIDGDSKFVTGPMAADIYAIRDLYNSSNLINVEDNDYIFNISSERTKYTTTTIVDDDGRDRISALGEAEMLQEIFLDGSVASSILGGESNLIILNGTEIEDFRGGESHDIVYGTSYGNVLETGGGDDVLQAGLGENYLDGGDGIDTARYELGALSLLVARTSEFDPLYVESFSFEENNPASDDPWLMGGSTKGDIFDSLDGIEKIETGGGNDSIFIRGFGAWSGNAQTGNLVSIHAGAGSDYIEGSDARDLIFGDEGDDLILGHEDASEEYSGTPQSGTYDGDTIHGGGGNDEILGYEGDDNLIGDDGDDYIRGNSGSDTIDGGSGSDIIEGGYHEDVIAGGEGDDFLFGFEISESLVDVDASTNEAMFRKIGSYFYTGELNDNELSGGSGDDYLIGSGGDDTLSGGDDNDVLYGGHGSDDLIGGDGSDTFVFHGSWNGGAANDDDYILDFISTDDQILLSKPETPDEDLSDPFFMGFGWEFETNRIVFTYREASWNSEGVKTWTDREGASLHISGTYDPSTDIQYVDDYAFT